MFEKFEGFGHKIGFGTTPAVVVVDYINAFTDPESPLGADFSKKINATNTLLQAAREKNIPIFFTTVSYEKSYIDAGNFIKKVPAMDVLLENTAMVELNSNITRIPEKEPLIVKKYASSFFGTSLHSMLAVNKVDTLIVIGVTTSGCVRATAVDGLQYGYRVIIPVECVGDRSKSAHEANLYDLNTKYADVMSLKDVIEHLNSIDNKADGSVDYIAK